jgi:hypothetical protein
MTGTVLLFRGGGEHPFCQIALAKGDRVQLALDGSGLLVSKLGPPGSPCEVLFRAQPTIVAAICAGLVGPKRQSDASPLRILAAVVQGIGTAAEVRAAFEAAAADVT